LVVVVDELVKLENEIGVARHGGDLGVARHLP
jgi:hypothetical protein